MYQVKYASIRKYNFTPTLENLNKKHQNGTKYQFVHIPKWPIYSNPYLIFNLVAEPRFTISLQTLHTTLQRLIPINLSQVMSARRIACIPPLKLLPQYKLVRPLLESRPQVSTKGLCVVIPSQKQDRVYTNFTYLGYK